MSQKSELKQNSTLRCTKIEEIIVNNESKAVMVTILSSLAISTTCLAQWRTTCQPGGSDYVVTLGGELLVDNSAQSIWESPDSGKTWMTILSEAQVGSVLMSALFVNNRTIFVGTEGNGVYRSTNNGTDWVSADSGMSPGTYNMVWAFGAIGDTVLAASGNLGVFRSENGGLTWTEADSGLPGKGTYSISAFATIGSTIFASMSQGIYKSSDYGSHWTNIAGGSKSGVSGPVTITSSGSNLLACMQWGLNVPPYSISWYLAVSTDGGSTWTADSTGASSFPPGIEITAFGSSGNEVFAETTQNGIFRSTDGGVSWSSASNGIFGTNSLYGSIVFQGSNIFTACGQNLFESSDNGENWRLIANGLPGDTTGISSRSIFFEETVLSLAANSSGLFAGTQGNGVYVSRDNGVTWSPSNQGLPSGCNVNTITTIGDSDLVAGIAGTFVPGTIYRSTDDGASWVDVNNGLSINTGVYGLASIGPKVFAAGSSGGYLSTDGGINWTLTNGNGGFPSKVTIGAAFAQRSTFFAGGTGTGVLVSTDGGTQWSVSDSGIPVNANVSSIGGDGTNVFVATDVGFYRSTDDGTSWAAADSGIPAGTVFGISTVSGVPGYILFAAGGGGAYMNEFLSTDGGTSWKEIDQGMIPVNVSSAVIDSSRIFIGVESGGSGFGEEWGVWYWQLSPVTSVKGHSPNAEPSVFRLYQNYPNPFNPTTVISYKLSAISNVTLKVYDILGRVVATLVSEKQNAGNYSVTFDGGRLASGVYFYRLTAGNFVSVKKLVLVK